jgi:hypothetical protein
MKPDSQRIDPEGPAEAGDLLAAVDRIPRMEKENHSDVDHLIAPS